MVRDIVAYLLKQELYGSGWKVSFLMKLIPWGTELHSALSGPGHGINFHILLSVVQEFFLIPPRFLWLNAGVWLVLIDVIKFPPINFK